MKPIVLNGDNPGYRVAKIPDPVQIVRDFQLASCSSYQRARRALTMGQYELAAKWQRIAELNYIRSDIAVELATGIAPTIAKQGFNAGRNSARSHNNPYPLDSDDASLWEANRQLGRDTRHG